MSSLTADDSARGNVGGGGVWVAREFQKSLLIEPRPLEWRDPNAPNKPLALEPSRLMLLSLSSSGSSGTPPSGPSRSGAEGSRLGDDCAVTEGPSSASRTCRIISASRRTSLSTGADSSKSSALMRPNCRDFGYESQHCNMSRIQIRVLTSIFPLLTTGRLTTPGVCGKAAASSPLSLPDEIWRSLAKSERLSRREPALRIAASRAK